LAAIRLPFFGMDLDSVGVIRLRLGEHALHTWDIAVLTDQGATVAPDAAALLIYNVPQFLAPRLGKPQEEPFRARIRTSDPDRDYLLTAAAAVSMTDWPGEGTGDSSGADATAEISMPAEALLRLAYGRLDPWHTPAGVSASPAELDQLRAIFPGFWLAGWPAAPSAGIARRLPRSRSAELPDHSLGHVQGAAPGERHARAAMSVVVHDAAAAADILRLQPDQRANRPEPDPVRQHRRPGQPGLDGGAAAQDACGGTGIGLEAPVPGDLRSAQDDGVPVREQVSDLAWFPAVADEEVGDARIGCHQDLAADRHHGRVRHKVSRADPRAVHDHSRG